MATSFVIWEDRVSDILSGSVTLAIFYLATARARM